MASLNAFCTKIKILLIYSVVLGCFIMCNKKDTSIKPKGSKLENVLLGKWLITDSLNTRYGITFLCTDGALSITTRMVTDDKTNLDSPFPQYYMSINPKLFALYYKLNSAGDTIAKKLYSNPDIFKIIDDTTILLDNSKWYIEFSNDNFMTWSDYRPEIIATPVCVPGQNYTKMTYKLDQFISTINTDNKFDDYHRLV